MKTKGISRRQPFVCFFIFLALSFPSFVRAQLVNDGQTNVLDGVLTNASSVNVGTNASFTLLVVTNGSVVTNVGDTSIGSSAVSDYNRLAIGGAGSAWNSSGYIYVGNSGSFNELDVLAGGTLSNAFSCYIGDGATSSNNTIWVSDAGSLWQCGNQILVGYSKGGNNQLVVTNGGTVSSPIGVIGPSAGQNNAVIVTGIGSVWTNSGPLAVGAYSPNCLLLVTNGGTVFSSGLSGIGTQGSSSVSNLAVITDPGSVWTSLGTSSPFYVGYMSAGNELNILNGGKLITSAATIGGNSAASNNLVLISDPGSVWTNSSIYVGNGGRRNMLIVTNAGQLFTGIVTVGNTISGSNNSVVVSGTNSAWNSGYFYLGSGNSSANSGSINNGGAVVCSSTFDIGAYSSSNLCTLTDPGSSLQCQLFRIGYNSSANQCVISNGAILDVLSSSQPTMIDGTSTRVTIAGAGTVWTNVGDFHFGEKSQLLAITAGGTLIDSNGDFIRLPDTDGSNIVIVAGAGSLWKNLADFHMFDVGAQLLITNGGTLLDNYGYFGDASSGPNSNCTAVVSGAGSLWTNQLDSYIGYNGASNQLFVTDSGALRARTLYVGFAGAGNRLIVSNSGTVTVRGLQVGNATSQSNNVILSGGTITLTNGGLQLALYASVTINSGLLTAPSIVPNPAGGPPGCTIILNGGTLQAGHINYQNTNRFVVGDGTDAATFEMLYVPPFADGSRNFPGGVSISNNGLVKGFGTLSGDISVNSGGTISPGTNATIGSIVSPGNLILSPGSTTKMKLNALPGTSDTITGMTNVTYGGTLQVINQFAPFAAGNSFKLFGATNYFGAFDNIVPATPGSGLRWDTYELNVDGVLRVFSVPSSPPSFSSVTAANGNLVVSAKGGIPYDPCYLLTSSNLIDWSSITTNYFDSTGATSFTNSIPPDSAQGYFRLQVN